MEQGTGEGIGEALLDFVDKNLGLNIDDVSILGGDSTNTNVGKNEGFIAVVKRKMVTHSTVSFAFLILFGGFLHG